MVETPIISVATGTYETAQSVTFSCATPNTLIYYTINGNTPTNNTMDSNNRQYMPGMSEPIVVSTTTTVKARAYNMPPGREFSADVATSIITIAAAQEPSVSTPTITLTNGSGASKYLLFSGDPISIWGSTGVLVEIKATTNGSDPTTSNYQFSIGLNENGNMTHPEDILLKQNTVIKAIAVLTKFGVVTSVSNIATTNFVINPAEKTKLPIPTFSVPSGTYPGTYNSPFSFSILCPDYPYESTIYYSMWNEVEPTKEAGMSYSMGVSLSEGTRTFRARVYPTYGDQEIFLPSDIASVTITVATPQKLNMPVPNHENNYNSENPFTLTLTNPNDSGIIEYTIDNIEMFDTNYISGGLICINKSCQVTAIVKQTDTLYTDSDILTLNFTVTNPNTVADPIITQANNSVLTENSEINVNFNATKLYYTMSLTDENPNSNSTISITSPTNIPISMLDATESTTTVWMNFIACLETPEGNIYSNIVKRCYTVNELIVSYSFTYTNDGTNATITGLVEGNTYAGAIEIPSSIDGYTITTIEEHAFSSYSNLTSVILPNSVTDINQYAFDSCHNLKSTTLSNNLQNIQNNAFSSCENLESILLPESVINIGHHAFFWCSKLTSINIPANTTNIELMAFQGLINLTSFTVDSNNNNYTAIDNILYNKTQTELIQFMDYSTNNINSIPNTVSIIKSYAFIDHSQITSITFPENLTTIESYAFIRCPLLTSITFPSSITTIGDKAFANFNGMTPSNLIEALFIGNAPTTVGADIFESSHQDFKIKYYESTTGWTTPTWNGYPTEMIGESITNPPTITLAEGTYYTFKLITMWADDNCEIYYTLDGTTPSHTNPTQLYSNNFSLDETATIKAIAFNTITQTESEIISKHYDIYYLPMPPSLIEGSVDGLHCGTTSIKIFTYSDNNAKLAYTLDGSNPTNSNPSTVKVESNQVTLSLNSNTNLKVVAYNSLCGFIPEVTTIVKSYSFTFIGTPIVSGYSINGSTLTVSGNNLSPELSFAFIGDSSASGYILLPNSGNSNSLSFTIPGSNLNGISTPQCMILTCNNLNNRNSTNLTNASNQFLAFSMLNSMPSSFATKSNLFTPDSISAPISSLSNGVYSLNQNVFLSCTTANAIIYYTLDGSTPTLNSNRYSTQLKITSTTTLKTIAIKNGISSPINTYTYTITPQVPIVTFQPIAGVYPETQTVSLACNTTGTSIYYTLDGSIPTTSSNIYSTPITISNTQTVKAIAIKENMVNSEVITSLFTVQTPTATGEIICNPSNKKLTLNWQEQPEVEVYDIYVNNEKIKSVTSSDTLTCPLPQIKAGCNSTVEIVGKNSFNQVKFTKTILALGVPNTVKSLSMTSVTSNSVSLYWKSWSNVTGYVKSINFYISDGTTTTKVTKTYSETFNMKVTLNSLTSNTNYKIYATTFNGQNESPNSNLVKFKTL